MIFTDMSTKIYQSMENIQLYLKYIFYIGNFNHTVEKSKFWVRKLHKFIIPESKLYHLITGKRE